MTDLNQPTPTNSGSDLLSEEAEQLMEYHYASQGQRFANWLIDNLFINYAVAFGTGFLIALLLNELFPGFLQNAFLEKGIVYYLFVYAISIFDYLVYYTLCEKLFKGYTLGKLVTGTRAIQQNGQELTVGKAFLRSLIRCVPFEIFSGFNTLTWHDSWTNTMVVKSR